LTLNDRWKRLPPWVQWTVIGVLVVVMAVVIFAIPTGGGAPNTAPATGGERRPAEPEKDRPADDPKAGDGKAPQERRP
jgi:hypothetical protein